MEKILFICFLTISCSSMHSQEKQFSLYYENDQYELNENHRRFIDSLNQLDQKDLYDIHIIGYTNSVGEKDYNLELSRKRAENVKSELRAFTIISSVGLGELDSESANNRRVDVFIHRKEDHIPVVGEIVEAPVISKPVLPSIRNLKNPKIGDKVTLQGIMFYPDQDVIMDESKNTLEELLAFLKLYPTIKFKLIGHICCGDKYKPYIDLKNVRTGKNDLSEARAKSLYNYLLKNGVQKSRMRYLGMAYRHPTGEGDEFDRRVEIEITSLK